jgi:hypothetical protein
VAASIVVAMRSFDATRTRRTLLVAVVVGPVLQVLYFAAVSAPTIVIGAGASLLLATLTAVDAVTVSLTRLRHDAVLGSVLLSARPAVLLWSGVAIAAAGVGCAEGLVSLVWALLLFGQGVPWQVAAGAIGLTGCAALAGSGCGFAVGVLGLRSREGLAWVGPFSAILTVLGGVVAPVDELPPVVEAVARVLPLGYASDALRTLLGEGSIGALAVQTGAAVVLGAAWFGLGLLGWALARRTLRRTGGTELL